MSVSNQRCKRAASLSTIATRLCFTIIIVGCRGAGEESPSRIGSERADSSLLVVPFETIGDSGGGWFGVGLAADVERLLGLQEGLAIQPWNATSLGAKSGAGSLSSDTTLLNLGRAADASLVLGGFLRRQGVRSELSLRLLRTRDGMTLWSGTYWREASALSSFPSEIATEVSDALRHAPPLRR